MDVDEGAEETSGDTSGTPPPGNKVIFALPPPIIKEAWGESETIPNASGIFARYVASLQNGENEKIVPRVILRYFAGCLGSNPSEVRDLNERLQSDFGNLRNTDIGKELAHMAFCIDVGLSSQARIFPVIVEGQYIGCCLYGWAFSIGLHKRVYYPVNGTDLKDFVVKAGSHKATLEYIASLLSDEGEQNKILDATSMVQLYKVLENATTTAEDREKICIAAKNLKFPCRYLNVSKPNIIKALGLVESGLSNLDDTCPIHPSALFSVDPVEVAWSCFGDLAPTPHFIGGPVIDLTNAGKLPSKIVFRTAPLEKALIDIHQIFIEMKFSGAPNLQRRSGVYQNRVYEKADASAIFTALRSATGSDKGKSAISKDRPILAAASTVLDDGF
jgi:hypothetical protein